MKVRTTFKEIDPQFTANYCRIVVKQVNISKEAYDKLRKKSITGLIKVSSLSNNRNKHSDPRLNGFVF